MKRTLGLFIALLLMACLCACGATAKNEAIINLLSTVPTYPEAVKLLGEPTEEEMGKNYTQISYIDYPFYDLKVKMALGFKHPLDAPQRTNDEFDWMELYYHGENAEIKKAANKIAADFDKLFGEHKVDSDGMFVWKNKQRIEIGLYTEDDFLYAGYGNM